MASIHDLFPSRWLTAHDLDGKDYIFVIRRVTVEPMKTKTETTEKPVVWFSGSDKGLVLNKTNAVTIAKLYDDETDKWTGKPITLYPTRERAFGETWDVVRVRPTRPPMPAQTANGQKQGPVAIVSEPEPATPPTRDDLVAQWNNLVDKAINLGITVKWEVIPDDWSLDKVGRTVGALAAKVREAEDMAEQAA